MTQNRATFNCWGGELIGVRWSSELSRLPMLTEIEYWAYIDNIHTYIIYVDTDLTLPVVRL